MLPSAESTGCKCYVHIIAVSWNVEFVYVNQPSTANLKSSFLRIWYNLIELPFLFDLFNVVQLSKVGPVSPIELSDKMQYAENITRKTGKYD